MRVLALTFIAALALTTPAFAQGMTACEEDELLTYLNRSDLTEQALKDADVHSNAARSVFAYRAGPDQTIDTPDDEYFDDTAEIDGLGFVGPAAMRQLAYIVKPKCEHPSIRLGAWNIKKMGHGESKDYPLLARIIEDKFDVLAVVEVMQKDNKHPGYDDLVAALGQVSSDWTSFVTDNPRPNTGAGHAEFYALFLRKNVARPCPDWAGSLRYIKDNDGGPSGTGTDVFSREPAYMCIQVWLDGANSADFMLGIYHALHEGSATKIQAEVNHIDHVFHQMSDDKPTEWDLFVMGDFNLRPKKLHPCTKAKDHTVPSPSTLNSEGGLGKNEYDHLLVRWLDESRELLGPAEVLDVRYYAGSRKDFFDTVSDHLPIRVRVRVDSTDDD